MFLFHDSEDPEPSGSDEVIYLYRYEYMSEGDIKFDWIWLDPTEDAEKYFTEMSGADYHILNYRKATDGELEVYHMAHEDGKDLGYFQAVQRMDNGIAYRLVGTGTENSLEELVSQKIFRCGKCGETRDFDTQAMKGSEKYYIAIEKEMSVLWHLCLDCFMEDSDA